MWAAMLIKYTAIMQEHILIDHTDFNQNWHLQLPLNQSGRDFIVGDIHGEVSLFERALRTLHFDPACDRILALGDLIDRGENPFAMLQYLAKPWFYSCLGNHESMMLDYASDMQLSTKASWVRNGGVWYFGLTPVQMAQACQLASQHMYWAITLQTSQHTIGLVHADLPSPCHWPDFIEQLPLDIILRNTVLWGRSRAAQPLQSAVTGVDSVFFGHTIMPVATQYANCWFIDTGACMRKRTAAPAALTMMQVQPTWQCFDFVNSA